MDIGCGTGHLSKCFADYFPESKIEAIDSSENMIEEIRKLNAKNINAKCIDYLSMDISKKFDLIISNAALHWMDINQSLDKIANQLNPKATALLAIFGSRTFMELQLLLPKIQRYNPVIAQTFMTNEEIKKIGNQYFKNWSVQTETITITFKSVYELLKGQKNTGVNITQKSDGLWTPRQMQALEAAFIEKYAKIQLTYEVHFCIGAAHE